MHEMIAVLVESDSPKDVLSDAALLLNNTHDGEYEYAITDSHGLDDVITTKDGEKVQYCEASKFGSFTDGLPTSLVSSSWWVHSYMMKKYGVKWSDVLETEIQERSTSGYGDYKHYVVCLDIVL